jgi:DNA polymerase III subunit delta'
MKFTDIPGNKSLKERLIHSVTDNRISHAQLFLGNEGYGSLPMAIAYAQYISCESKKSEDSCGICPSCQKYEKLIHPDLHFAFPVVTTEKVKSKPVSSMFLTEWREAVLANPFMNLFSWLEFIGVENKQGNISVEESHEILRSLSLKTYEAEYKIMIIWLPEKLHISAANKLLKIIEEPPEKTLFLLVSENYEAILPTILSRLQLVKLYAPSVNEISLFIGKKFSVNEINANTIASRCEGNINLAITLAGEGDQSGINESLFLPWMRLCFSFRKAAKTLHEKQNMEKNIIQLSEWVDKIAQTGRERQKIFLNHCLYVFRECIMLNYESDNLLKISEQEKTEIQKFAPFINEINCIEIINEFNDAVYQIERNAHPKILFMDLSLKVSKLLWAKEKV